MATFKKLTSIYGKTPVWVNLDAVSRVRRSHDGSLVYTQIFFLGEGEDEGSLDVKEKPEAFLEG